MIIRVHASKNSNESKEGGEKLYQGRYHPPFFQKIYHLTRSNRRRECISVKRSNEKIRKTPLSCPPIRTSLDTLSPRINPAWIQSKNNRGERLAGYLRNFSSGSALYPWQSGGKQPTKEQLSNCELTLGISRSNLTWNRPEASRDVLISGRTTESHGGMKRTAATNHVRN